MIRLLRLRHIKIPPPNTYLIMIIKLDSGDYVITGNDAKRIEKILEKEKLDVVMEENSPPSPPLQESSKKRPKQAAFDNDSADLAQIKKIVDEYNSSDNRDCIEISDLSKSDRHQLHMYAGGLKTLKTWSTGSDSNRTMFIQKK